MKNKLNYGIIGLGRFGTALAYSLARMGAEILVVDRDEAKVSQLREITENAFIASTLEKKALEERVCALEADFAALNGELESARAGNDELEAKLARMGRSLAAARRAAAESGRQERAEVTL